MSDFTPDIYGSEEGWAAASHDSRRDQKQRDIKALVSKMQANHEAAEAAKEASFYDGLVEAAGPVVHAGLEKKGSTLGSTRSYRNRYDEWRRTT